MRKRQHKKNIRKKIVSAYGQPPLCADIEGYSWWCGYVGIPKDHAWFGLDIDDYDHIAYGGVTYADDTPPPWLACDCGDTAWWIGFDTHHGYERCESFAREATTALYKLALKCWR